MGYNSKTMAGKKGSGGWAIIPNGVRHLTEGWRFRVRGPRDTPPTTLPDISEEELQKRCSTVIAALRSENEYRHLLNVIEKHSFILETPGSHAKEKVLNNAIRSFVISMSTQLSSVRKYRTTIWVEYMQTKEPGELRDIIKEDWLEPAIDRYQRGDREAAPIPTEFNAISFPQRTDPTAPATEVSSLDKLQKKQAREQDKENERTR